MFNRRNSNSGLHSQRYLGLFSETVSSIVGSPNKEERRSSEPAVSYEPHYSLSRRPSLQIPEINTLDEEEILIRSQAILARRSSLVANSTKPTFTPVLMSHSDLNTSNVNVCSNCNSPVHTPLSSPHITSENNNSPKQKDLSAITEIPVIDLGDEIVEKKEEEKHHSGCHCFNCKPSAKNSDPLLSMSSEELKIYQAKKLGIAVQNKIAQDNYNRFGEHINSDKVHPAVVENYNARDRYLASKSENNNNYSR